MRARVVIAILLASVLWWALLRDTGSAGNQGNGSEGNAPPPTASGKTTNGTPEAIAVQAGDTTIATYRRPGRGSGGPRWTCTYYQFSAGLGAGGFSGGPRYDLPPPTFEEGMVYWLQCVDEENKVVYSNPVVWNPADPFGGVAAGSRAAEQALQALPLPNPVVHSNPPETSDLLVGIDTWFRVDTAWAPLSASATVSAISATVTATPRDVAWDFGDRTQPRTCDGPGLDYAEARGRESDCTHVYTHRSTSASSPGANADGTYTVTATVTYDVSWTATDGTSGTLEPVTRTGTAALRVTEAQALIR